jgi:regulator of sigma E protease
MMMTIYTVAVVLLLFSFTIFVHELGHFLAARWMGMTVDAFAIGFGPAIWKRKINGVMYKIGWLPFGGYVALPQLDPTAGNPNKDVPAGERVLPAVAPWRRIIVSVAGPIGNIILAFILAWVIYIHGKPSEPHEANTLVGFVETNSQAWAEGLRVGDAIQSVNGSVVRSWEDIMLAVSLSPTATLQVVAGDGAPKEMTLDTHKIDLGGRIMPGVDWMSYALVAGVEKGSSAEKGGIRIGDRIVEFNGQRIYSRGQLIWLVNEAADQDVPVIVKRGSEHVTLAVRPAMDPQHKRARIGVAFDLNAVDYDTIVHPKPLAQMRNHIAPIFRLLQALVTPSEAKAASEAVGGAPAILFVLWLKVKTGLIMAIWFAAMLNVNLAILNLLPLPVLDGGHIVVALVETVIRRPVPPRIVNWLWNTGAVALILLMVLLSVRDIRRISGIFRDPAPAAQTNTLPAAAEPVPVSPSP